MKKKNTKKSILKDAGKNSYNTSEFEIKKFGKEIRDHFDVVVEEMKDSIKLVAEGQVMLRGEMNRRFDEVDKRFDEHDKRLDGIDGRLYKHDGMFSEINSKLDTTLEYLIRIDEEITQIKEEIKEIKEKMKYLEENKIGKKDKEYVSLVEKVLNIEKEVKAIKIALKLKTA